MSVPLLLKDGVLSGTSRFDGSRPEGGSLPPEGGPGPLPRPVDDSARFGLWLLLGTISMLFIGFTSALMVRRASSDWVALDFPALLWFNTGVLAASSLTLEVARRQLRAWRYTAVVPWLTATGSLGMLFVARQWEAWQALRAQGVFLSSNPHSSFFYMLTGVHLAHILAALIWFTVVFHRARHRFYPAGSDGLGLFATFWHFLGGLWAYLLFVLFVL